MWCACIMLHKVVLDQAAALPKQVLNEAAGMRTC